MKQINKILVPIDFSENSINALKHAVDFAETFGSKLYLTYIVEPMLYPADFSMGQIAIPDVSNDLVKRGEEEMDLIIREFVEGKVPYEKIIRTGRPFIEIIEAASEYEVDLIIISTHGHTGVEHLLFGSTAEKVVRKAPCPVLTVRNPIKGFKYQGS